jgi:recombination protein RecA
MGNQPQKLVPLFFKSLLNENLMAKKTTEKPTKIERIDDLASDVLSIINKSFKEFPDAGTFLNDANLVVDWVSTGCDILDLAISNRPNGGQPTSKILEYNGLEASGKSLVAATTLAQCQKRGGIAVLFDTEGAVGMLDFYRSIGLDTQKLIYIEKLRTLEEIYQATENIIVKYNESRSDKPLVIVIDSVSGATTKKELEEDYEKKGYATDKAIVNTGAMRRLPTLINGKNILIILVQQLRANMNAFGPAADPFTTTGGTAIPYTASVRLRFKKMGQIKGKINGIDTTVGERIQVQIIKNRVGPPRRKITFDVRYDSGIDNYGSWLTCLKELGAIGQSGSSYTYKFVDEETGEEITKKFQSKDFKALLTENPELKERIYKQICDEYIMKYDTGEDEEELGIDDIELEVTNED